MAAQQFSVTRNAVGRCQTHGLEKSNKRLLIEHSLSSLKSLLCMHKIRNKFVILRDCTTVWSSVQQRVILENSALCLTHTLGCLKKYEIRVPVSAEWEGQRLRKDVSKRSLTCPCLHCFSRPVNANAGERRRRSYVSKSQIGLHRSFRRVPATISVSSSVTETCNASLFVVVFLLDLPVAREEEEEDKKKKDTR